MWFAIQTWPRYEKKVAREVTTKSIEVFLPLISVKHQWRDRQQAVDLPLFAGYLFVQTPGTTQSRISVLRIAGVTSFVGSHGAGTPVPDSEIESVRILLTRGVPVQTYPFLDVGQRVRIRGNSLDGVEGILIAKNDDLSLVVSINIIQRSVSVRIEGYRLEAA